LTSQAATSRGLKLLRLAFDDRLLVKTGAGMILTKRAEALRGPLATWLRQTDDVLALLAEDQRPQQRS